MNWRIEVLTYPRSKRVAYRPEYAELARQVWPDHDETLGGDEERNWLIGARDPAERLVAYVRFHGTDRPDEVHMPELVVAIEYRGHGIGERLVTAMAVLLLADFPHRTTVSMQPIAGDAYTTSRRRWFRQLGFSPSTADDDTNGIWFAHTSRLADGRQR